MCGRADLFLTSCLRLPRKIPLDWNLAAAVWIARLVRQAFDAAGLTTYIKSDTETQSKQSKP